MQLCIGFMLPSHTLIRRGIQEKLKVFINLLCIYSIFSKEAIKLLIKAYTFILLALQRIATVKEGLSLRVYCCNFSSSWIACKY